MAFLGFKKKSDFPDIYRDYIRTHGAPSALCRDNALEEQSKAVDTIHRELYIKDEFSEPHNQQQNPVESRVIKYIKDHVHTLLDRTGAPDTTWFCATVYLCEIHNILSNKQLPDGITPRQAREGVTPNISPWLQFTFYQQVLYLDHEGTWPSSKERAGRWMGVCQNIGDALTFWILDDQTKRLLARSVVRPFNRNFRVKWDPALATKPVRETAHHGGNIMPTTEEIKDKMSRLTDKYDDEEPEPEGRFFDACDTPEKPSSEPPETTPLIMDKHLNPYVPLIPMLLDTSLSKYVNVVPDEYQGPHQLRFSRHPLDINKDIPSFPMQKKKMQNDIKYEHEYHPEEYPEEVKIMPTEPEDDGGLPIGPRNEEKGTSANDHAEKGEMTNDPEDFGSMPAVPEHPETPRRASQRTRKEPERFAGNMKTVWKPGRTLGSWAAALALGILLLPSVILAEPVNGLTDIGNAGLFPEATSMQPLDATEKTEHLRAYHARLGFINDAFSDDPENDDWKPERIDKYLIRTDGRGLQEIMFKVQWMGEKSLGSKWMTLGHTTPFW